VLLTEGLTEGAQQSINIAAENFVGKNPQIFDSEDWRRVAESVVAGAAVGTPLVLLAAQPEAQLKVAEYEEKTQS
jgi:hypothetical protein